MLGTRVPIRTALHAASMLIHTRVPIRTALNIRTFMSGGRLAME
jgi:hypothetical protein